MTTLRGIAWEHPRATRPLREASRVFAETHGVEVVWDTRSLAGFEEAGIADLASRYDMIAIDHPFMGAARADGVLVSMEDLLPTRLLTEFAGNAVGRSWDSYLWDGQHWAAPVDAAAQVSAHRADLAPAGLAAAPSWTAVEELAKSRPGRVAIALNPTHMLLTTFTICHALAPDASAHDDLTPAWWRGDEGPARDVLVAAVELLGRVIPALHPGSLDWDPIQLLDAMCSTDAIDYTPAIFGYCTYARSDEVERPVVFGDVPGADGVRRGGMLGGVGLAVSTRCESRTEVADFLALVAGEQFQSGGYARVGGQPAHRSAWLSEQVNTWTPGFFAPTLASLDAAFVRPRVPHYPRYQHSAGQLMHRLNRAGTSAVDIADALREHWRSQGGAPRP